MTTTMSAPARGPVTTRVLTELAGPGFPVGDDTHPDIPYGWTGEPDQEGTQFIPWLMLTPLAGTPQRIPGAFSDTGAEWSLPYSVFYAGVTRKQTEALADRVRARLCNITREVVGTDNGNWKIMKISCTALGSTNRIGGSVPDYYTQADTFDVWVSKEN